jgi:hypothetical protein
VHAVLLVVWGPATADAAIARWAVPALYALAFAALAVSFRSYRCARERTRGQAPVGSAAGILLVALVLRLLALPLAPALSNDVHRYAWDGRVVLAGENPYRLAPGDPALAPLRDETWERVEHREVATVYPPLALCVFALAAATPWPVLALKVLLAADDLAGCAALLALARRLGLPPERTVWYAWSPLAVIETAGMGHVDALGVAAAVAAALWVAPSGVGRRPAGPIGAGAFAAAGALAKLAPLLALPHWARRSGRPWLTVAVAGAILLAALLPVAISVGGVPPGLVTYGVSWEFNGPLYEPLHRTLAALDAGEAAKAFLDRLKVWTGEHDVWNRFYPWAYPRFFAKLALGLLLLLAVVRSLRDRRPVAGPGALFGAALVASATVYPWYLLWVLPWAALALQPAWLLAVATAPLAYWAAVPGASATGPAEVFPVFPWVWLAVWGPPAVLALVRRSARRFRDEPAEAAT